MQGNRGVQSKWWAKGALIFGITLLLFSLPVFCGGCGDGDAEATVTEFDAVRGAVGVYLASPEAADFKITAEALHNLMYDGDDNTTPHIISICETEHYAKGHIPGAVNIAFEDLFKEDTLATLDALPTAPSPDIVIYCYNGNASAQAAAILGVMGYDVKVLKHGKGSWTSDTDASPYRYTSSECMLYDTDVITPVDDPSAFACSYRRSSIPTVSYGDQGTGGTASMATISYNGGETTDMAPLAYDVPSLDNTTSADEEDIIRAAAQSYASLKTISASQLHELMYDGNDDTTPFIIDTHSRAEYEAVYIPGAVCIGLTSLMDNLDNLPTDRKIVVYCCTGHGSSQAVGVLNMLGYDAWGLTYGICSWSNDALTQSKCFKDSKCKDYELET